MALLLLTSKEVELMRFYLVEKDPFDNRDLLYKNRHLIVPEKFPSKIDLRKNCSPIVNQGNLSACTANAIVSGLREYILINDERYDLVRLSRLYLYWWERYMENTVNEDSGANLRDGMKVLQKKGVCTEDLYPYDPDLYRKAPSFMQNLEAHDYTIPGYQRLLSINEIKHALLNNHIVVFSMILYKSFEKKITKNGIVPHPRWYEQKLGGHAMCIVGYDDNLNNGSFIVRNSWGKEFGDKGYCYLPYSMSNYIMDAWTVKFTK